MPSSLRRARIQQAAALVSLISLLVWSTIVPTATVTAAPPRPKPTPTPSPIVTPAPTPTATRGPTTSSCPAFTATYFDEMALEPGRQAGTACESAIARDWGVGAPGFGLRDNWFSVRFTGSPTFAAGNYTFTLNHDNGVRLWIDGTLVLDRWATLGTATVTRTLSAGTHALRLEYYEDAGSAYVQLSWATATTTPAPTASPTPVVTPTPSPTATPAASTSAGCVRTVSGFTATAVHAARDGAGAGTVCFPAGTYTGALSASVAGQTWSLAPGAVITGPINVSGAGVTIRGGTIERPTTDRWAPSVRVDADGVTVEGITFLGGGQVVSIQGNDRTRVRNNTFTGQSGSAIAIWGDGVGADDTLIEGNTITQTITYQVSPITSRGNESNVHAGVQNARTIVRNNTIDQGIGNVGWFGVEFKQSAGTLVEGNTIRGGWVLISFPETDGAIVRNNTLDMRGTPNWGIEVANSYDVTVEGNTFIGGGTSAGDHAVSLNSGSLRTTVRGNTVRDVRTLFDVSGDWHTVTDNCLANVLYEYEYRSSGGPNITFARNGPCG